MKKMKYVILLIAVLVVIGFSPVASFFNRASSLQRLANPGQLSASHAFLDNDCAACHTPLKGPEPSNCIVCHANNEILLQRQPTSFHANVTSCRECHAEHKGRVHRPVAMDHMALAKIGRLYDARVSGNTKKKHVLDPTSKVTLKEQALNCAACHAKEDAHSQQFGLDCTQCHTTEKWAISGFRHPSPRSINCNQCHGTPPCHKTVHFRDVCATVSGKPNAKVNQCFSCHQTTAWNDIKGVGWYKSH